MFIKFKAQTLLAINKVRRECRMFEKKPAEVCGDCIICAARGGHIRCDRSRSDELRTQANEMFGVSPKSRVGESFTQRIAAISRMMLS